MRAKPCSLVVLTLTALTAQPIAAQRAVIPIGSERERYMRLLQLDGKIPATSFSIRSLSANGTAGFATDSSHPWDRRIDLALNGSGAAPRRGRTTVIDPEFRIAYNTAYPRRVNDGAVWAGEGATASISGGLQFELGALTGTLFPTIYYSQNQDFRLVPVTTPDRSEFAYPWHNGGIDFPQRFGDRSFAEFDWGQTSLRLDLGAFTAGVGTENLWFGPAFQNGVIMSNAGPGFHHIDFGTGRQVWIGIGHLETRLVYGRLVESDYFDSDLDNDARFLAALALNYQPKWIPGLYLGGQRVLYQKWTTASVADAIGFLGPFFKESTRLPDGNVINDSTDQLLSVHARWLLPKAGFEAYIEWARNDFSGSLRDFVLEPDHSSGYTMGFHKSFASTTSTYLLRGELTHLGPLLPIEVRSFPGYYSHSLIQQGYTHRGQMIGAHIGPGSNSEFIGLDRYTSGGRLGVYFERVRFDDDAYFANFGRDFTRNGHDVELTAGFSMFRFLGPLEVGADLALSLELNRNFRLRPLPDDVTNLNAVVTAKWRIE